MAEISYVVVFPSIFAKNKIPNLITNIKKILNIKNQKFNSVKRDGDVIIVNANDPVFASSAINLLFGIDKVAIARQVSCEFDNLVSEITKLGGNLLLKGERFYVKVDGKLKGHTTKDLEIAATSSIIKKKANLGAKPGNEQNYEKLIYTYITKKNAYICIFLDEGHEGIPYGFHKKEVLCCIFDELSAVSCLQTIKEGFSTNIIICYNKRSDLIKLAKILDRVLPVTLTKNIEIDFYKLNFKPASSSSKRNYYQRLMGMIIEILVNAAKSKKIRYISLPLSPMIFPPSYQEYTIDRFKKEGRGMGSLVAVFPLEGIGREIFQGAKDLGLEKYLAGIENIITKKVGSEEILRPKTSELQACLDTKNTIKVAVGPNNVHDILDSLEGEE